MNLKAGDMLYFEPHRAVGVLLKKLHLDSGPVWEYCLRSPLRHDRDTIKVSIQEVSEERFIERIESGELEYYEAR